jgi:hypothetical protein
MNRNTIAIMLLTASLLVTAQAQAQSGGKFKRIERPAAAIPNAPNTEPVKTKSESDVLTGKDGTTITRGALTARVLEQTKLDMKAASIKVSTPAVARVVRLPANVSTVGSGGLGKVNDTSIGDSVLGCLKEGALPGIKSIEGEVRPGGAITLHGFCLGEKNGDVRLKGAYPGGALPLRILSWQESKVVVEVPKGISGVAEGQQMIQLNSFDRKASKDKPVWFVPDWVSVEIAGKLQRQPGRGCVSDFSYNNMDWDKSDCYSNGSKYFYQYEHAKPLITRGEPSSPVEGWQVTFNPNCYWEGLWWNQVGTAHLSNWKEKAPNDLSFDIHVFSKRWVAHVGYITDTIAVQAEYRLTSAKVMCPVGVAP